MNEGGNGHPTIRENHFLRKKKKKKILSISMKWRRTRREKKNNFDGNESDTKMIHKKEKKSIINISRKKEISSRHFYSIIFQFQEKKK